tara:strand:- start:231 stop:452 length:222 start_codon:yes stop_codon:yes gene_type:complete
MSKYLVTFKLKDQVSLIVDAEEDEAKEKALEHFRTHFWSSAYQAFLKDPKDGIQTIKIPELYAGKVTAVRDVS